MQGKVKWFNNKRGYGYIIPEEGKGDVFVHWRGIEMEGFKSLDEGQAVEFELGESPDGKPCAIRVKPIW